MRAAARIALRVLLSLGAAGVLAVAGAVLLVVALSRGFERERLARFVADQVGAALDAEVRIGRLEGALFDGFRAVDVELRDDGEGPPLTAAALVVRFDPSPLWRERRLAIASLELEGLRATLRDGDAGWRISGVGRPLTASDAGEEEPDGGAPPLRAVEVERLVVRDAQISLEIGAAHAPDATRAALALDAEASDVAWRDGAPLRLPPTLAAQATLAPSTVAGRAVERGALELRVDGARILVPGAALAGGFGTVTLAGGEVALVEAELPLRPIAASGRAAVAGLDLGALFGGPRLASRLDGPIELSFAPDDPAQPGAGTLDVRAELASGPVAGVAIDTIRLRGSGHTGTRSFALEELRVAGAAGVVEGSAAGGAERAESLALRADLDLAKLPEAWRGPLASGRLRAQAEARGAWADPRGTLVATVESLQVGDRGPGRLALRAEAEGNQRLRADELALDLPGVALRNDGPLRLRLADGAVAIEAFALTGPGLAASARGTIAGDAVRGLRVELAVEDVAAARTALGSDAPLAGRITGWIEADGPLRAPALRGELAAAPLVAGETRLERIELALRTEGARLRADGRLVDAGAERARFEAAAAREALLTAPGDLLARADTELRLTATDLALDWLAGLAGRSADGFAGRLAADVRLTGARPAPRATGFLRWDEGRVAVEALAEPLGPITLHLRLEGDALRVERFHVASHEGEIRGAGHVHWNAATAAPADTDLRVAFARFSLPPGGTVDGRLDGELALRGAWPDLLLGGRVVMDPGRFRFTRSPDPVWSEIRVHGIEGEEPAPARVRDPDGAAPQLPDAFARSRANVTLVVAEGSRFTGQGADLRLAGEIRLLKEAGAEPLFVGSIRTTEGFYAFRGRRFAVERGVATLAGTRELDPELDVVAAQQIGEVTLRVVVSGRASAPVVTLESDPPLDPADQMSYLAFGRPASALGDSDAARLEAAATQVMSELLLQSGVAATLFDRLPVGRLEFQSGGPDGAGLSVGAELLRGVRVYYARDLGAGESGARVQWRFHRRWMIQSEMDETGDTAADVIWTYEF
jgi:autotransporter translocation and assembly factor TamB